VMRLSRAEEVELDGDLFGRASALRTWVDPSSLTVKVPSTEASTDASSDANAEAA